MLSDRMSPVWFVGILCVPCSLALYSGCSPVSPQAGILSAGLAADSATSFFGDGSDRQFDHGHVIGDPSGRLSHTFVVRNQSEKPIGIVDVINGMPCCGEVDPVRPTILQPGQSLDLKVTVRPEKIGPLQHWASVTTDRPEVGEIQFRSVAEVHAPVRIEAADLEVPHVSPGQKIALKFNLIECLLGKNVQEDQPSEFEITIPGRPTQFRWEGTSKMRFLTDELIERVRPFSVALTAGEQSGAEGTELVLSDGATSRLTQQLRWIVTAAIKATPPLLTIDGAEPSTQTLVLSGTDGQRFKIIGITTNLLDVGAKPRESSGTRHFVDVTIDPSVADDSSRMGEIVITTDLAAQRSVRIPVVRIRKKATP